MNHEYINKFHVIEQYVLGKLAADEAEEFENHFIDCPECVEQLNITRSFIDDLKSLAVQETLVSSKPAPLPRRWDLQSLFPRHYWAAIGCGLVVVIGALAFFGGRRLTRLEAELRQAKEETSAINQQYQRYLETAAASEKEHEEARQQLAQRLDELEKKLQSEGGTNQSVGSAAPDVNFPIYALISVRGQALAPVEIPLSASSSRFALSIPVEDNRTFSSYRVTIMDHQGKTVWQHGGFKPDAYHALSLSLNSNFLTPDTYDLKVEGLTPPNQWNTVGSYPFRIARRR